MYDPQKIYEALLENGDDWADKKSAYELLDQMTKSILQKIKNTMPGKSDAERLGYAMAEAEYTDHLQSKNESYAAYLRAQVKYDSTKALADARRTQQSTRRAEAQYTGMQNG